jgi:hypothetical protein
LRTVVGMARAHRIDEAGLTYHVWANGVAGLPIFRDAYDRDAGKELLRDEAENSDWSILEFSFMSTHYHIVVFLRKATLSSGFKRFNVRYAQYFNRKYRKRGHVFDARFQSKIVEGRFGQCEVMRYVAKNASDARICDRPEQYQWSGYGATIGLFEPDGIVDIDGVLERFGSREAYRRYVEEPDSRVRWGLVGARPREDAPNPRPRRTRARSSHR